MDTLRTFAPKTLGRILAPMCVWASATKSQQKQQKGPPKKTQTSKEKQPYALFHWGTLLKAPTSALLLMLRFKSTDNIYLCTCFSLSFFPLLTNHTHVHCT